MSSFRPNINPKLIRWARLRAGLKDHEFTGPLREYRKWEEGKACPTFRQLELFASRTRTPFGYFFLPEPPSEPLPIPDFRTMKGEDINDPSPDLRETIYTLFRRQEWLREFLIDQGAEELSFVGSVNIKSSPNQVAKTILNTLGFKSTEEPSDLRSGDFRKDLKEAAEKVGITVVINGVVGNNTHRKLDPQEFRGFVLCDNYAPMIFVNGSDAKTAQVFTLAHELCHIWLNQNGIPNIDLFGSSNSELEQFCNQVAAEITVPADWLKTLWPKRDEDKPFEKLASFFQVSPIVVARRAYEIELIELRELYSFYNAYRHEYEAVAKDGEKAKSGGDFYLNQSYRIGDRFFSFVANAVKSGQLLYREAYRLTGLKPNTFEQYADRLGFSL